MSAEFFRLISRPRNHRSISILRAKLEMHSSWPGQAGHDEFSCEITGAPNTDGKINYRNPLAGAKPYPNRAQCPGRRDAE